jgi:protein phosphatase inhibitor 2
MQDEYSKPAAVVPGAGGEQEPGLKEDPHRRRVKPALKKKPEPLPSEEKKHLKWDEEAIEEHDLLRGTRMKIDEPNTPYTHYDSGAESDGSGRPKSPATQKNNICWDTLQTRLDSVAAVREAYPSSPSSHGAEAEHSEGEGGGEREKEMHKMEFQEHRKRHYNEMEQVRQFRQEHPDLEDDVSGDADVEDD